MGMLAIFGGLGVLGLALVCYQFGRRAGAQSGEAGRVELNRSLVEARVELRETQQREVQSLQEVAALEARLDEMGAALEREREDRLRTAGQADLLRERLEVFERDARALGKTLGEKQQSMSETLDDLSRRARSRDDAAARLKEIQERLQSDEKRQRTAEDDVAMALRSFGERGDKLHQQIAAIASQIEVLEAALREKTGQSRREADDIRSELETLRGVIDEKIGHSRREAEDIRTQIGPLLEAHGQRGANDEKLSQEFDRLRESIAESLGDLSERLRRAVGRS
jgi:chromosome segregation ATPase